MTALNKVLSPVVFLITLCLLFLAACSNTSDSAAKLVQLQLHIADTQLAPGTCSKLSATAVYDDHTHQDVTQQLNWQSLDSTVAAIDVDLAGQRCVKAQATGNTSISATLDEITASVVAKVVSTTLTSLQITSQTEQPKSGITKLKAIGLFADQHKQDLSDQVTWQLPGGVSIESGFLLGTGSVAGNTITIGASFAGLSTSTAITLNDVTLQKLVVQNNKQQLPIGISASLQVLGHYSDGSQLNLTPFVSWNSNTKLGSIKLLGDIIRFTATDSGTEVITFNYEGISVSHNIEVISTALSALQLRYDYPALPVGERAEIIAIGRFANGLHLDISDDVTWSSIGPDVINVSNQPLREGRLVAWSAGETTIRANVAGKQAEVNLTSHQANLSSLELSSTDYYLPQGNKAQFNAIAHYANDETWRISDKVIWQVADDTLATISNNNENAGLLSAISNNANPSSVTASYRGVSSQLAFHPVSSSVSGLNRIELYAQKTSLPLGTSTTLTALGIYSDGSKRDISHELTWFVDDPSFVNLQTVNGITQLQAVNAGTVSVTASLPGAIINSNLTLQLTDPQLQQLTFDSQPFTQPAGESKQLIIIGEYDNGDQSDLSQLVNFKVADSSIAEVFYDQHLRPYLRGLQKGQTTLTVTLNGVSSSQIVNVDTATLSALNIAPGRINLALGLEQQLQVIAQYSDGSSVDVTSDAKWQSLDQSVASVHQQNNQTQLVSTGLGTTQIKANYYDHVAQVTVTVDAAALQAITISPSTLDLPLGLTHDFSALGQYSDGSQRDITSQVVWETSDSSVAQVSNQQSGHLQSLAIGNATLTAMLSGKTTNANINISNAILTTNGLEITAPPSLAQGVEHQAILYGLYSDGILRELTSEVTWTSSNSAILSVKNIAESKGLMLAETVGSAIITASYAGQSISTTITVEDAVLSYIEIKSLEPSTHKTSMPKGWVARFSATAHYTDNTVQDITDITNWSSDDAQIASVISGAPGQFQTHTPGSVSINAQFNNLAANQQLTVLDLTFTGPITITSGDQTIPPLSQFQLQAKGNYVDASAQTSVYDLSSQVIWSGTSSQVAIGQGINGGLARSLDAGTTSSIITASFAGQSSSGIVLTVATDTINSIVIGSSQIDTTKVVDTATANLSVGMVLPLNVQINYQTSPASTTSSGVTWSSSAPDIVSVSNSPGTEGVITTHQQSTNDVTITAVLGTNSDTYNVNVAAGSTGDASKVLAWTKPTTVVQGEKIILCVAPLDHTNTLISSLINSALINGTDMSASIETDACTPKANASFKGYAIEADQLAAGGSTYNFYVSLDSLDATLKATTQSQIITNSNELIQTIGIQKSASPIWDGTTLKTGSGFSITLGNATGRDYQIFSLDVDVLDQNGILIGSENTLLDVTELSDGDLLGNETFHLAFTLDNDYPNAKKVKVVYRMSTTLTPYAGTNQTIELYPEVNFDL